MTTDWNKLTVVELRAELKKHGLPQAGKKADLIDRLSSAIGKEPSEDANQEATSIEQSAEPHNVAEAAPVTSETVAEESQEQMPPINEPVTDRPEAAARLSPIQSDEAAPKISPTADETADTQPPAVPVTTTTIDISAQSGSDDNISAAVEVIRDAQSRKRRSRTPSVDESVRKRLRPDDPEPRREDSEMTGISGALGQNTLESEEQEPLGPRQEPALPKEEAFEPVDESSEPKEKLRDRSSPHPTDLDRDTNTGGRVDMEGVQATSVAQPEPDRTSDRDQGYPADRAMEVDHPETDFASYERPVVPSVHPATSALYIKNFMRPLRPGDVKDHLISLATPPSKEASPDVIVDFFLDPIRTHAFVSFNSVSAASRVRSALHDQVWPDERNRKALWVDFIPPEKVLDWIDREEAGGGRGKMHRWEVVYEADAEGNMNAKLEEAGADAPRQNPRTPAPPAGPASTSIPTGPSQMNSGVQGAPLGPRGRGGRPAPPYGLQAAGNPQDGFKATRTVPSLLYKPASEEVARRRIDNMRSFYTKDKHRNMGREDEINRYTFENTDSFVDRGKEVFIGIRPPHREREMRHGGGRPTGPRPGPPPPSFRPRSDRYMGGRRNGREDFPPRSRLDGAPLPTYDGRSDRRDRNGYGGYAR